MEFQKECLKAHNDYREKHGVPPLVLNQDMCKMSQTWADTLAKKKILEHSKNSDYGENIYCVTSNGEINITGDQPVTHWYDEIKIHPFGTEPKTSESGHFTQVIWRDSRELGVAFAKLNNRVVVVANYYPAGNIIGRFVQNVPPVGGYGENNNVDLAPQLEKLSLKQPPPTKKNVKNGTQGDFEQDFLNAHNIYRSRHGVPALKLDKKLCKFSAEWAKNLADRNVLEHRKNSPYGENIYCMYSSDPNFTINGYAPVDTWYEEITLHPFGKEPSNLKSGHFTQVVWKNSEYLGVGVAKNRHNKVYVVANYSPAGNFVGDYVQNVPPLIGSPEAQALKMADEAKGSSEKESEPASPDGFSQFAHEGLKAHNEYRRKHGVPEMMLSKKLCEFAQEWADRCAKHSDMSHRPKNEYGENLFYVYSSDYSHVPSGRDAVKEWYDEIRDHKFGTEKVNNKTLHFTQVIWKESRELGIAMAKNGKGETYVVANYSPRGNFIGKFVDNVPKAR